MQEVKWSWNKFFVGISKLIFSKETAVWIVATAIIYATLENGFTDTIKITALIVWGVISLCFYFYPAISKLIEKGELKVGLEASAKVGVTKRETKEAHNEP